MEEMRELFKRTRMLPPEDLTLPGREPKRTPEEKQAAADKWSSWFCQEVAAAMRELRWKQGKGFPKARSGNMASGGTHFLTVNSNGTSHAEPVVQNAPPKAAPAKPAPKAPPCRPRRLPAALHAGGCGCPECVNVRERVRAEMQAASNAAVEGELLQRRMDRMCKGILVD
jgi:hypothetical protein